MRQPPICNIACHVRQRPGLTVEHYSGYIYACIVNVKHVCLAEAGNLQQGKALINYQEGRRQPLGRSHLRWELIREDQSEMVCCTEGPAAVAAPSAPVALLARGDRCGLGKQIQLDKRCSCNSGRRRLLPSLPRGLLRCRLRQAPLTPSPCLHWYAAQMPSQNQIGDYKLIELAGEGSFGKVRQQRAAAVMEQCT